MDLSVIVVNWNTKDLAIKCLESVFKLTKGVTFELIVVDNASSDGTSEEIKKHFPMVRLLENKQNLGYAKANNQGIKVAKGKYILLLNSDAYLLENSLPKLVRKAKSLSKFGALAPLILNEDKTVQQSGGFFPHLPQIFYWMTFIDNLPGGLLLKPFHINHNSFYRSDQTLDWLTGACILVSQNAIKKVGVLDENIFMYGEDLEWCFRLKKAGLQIYFSPVTKVVHLGGGSANKIRTSAITREYQGIIYFYQKYKGNISLQILKVLLKIGALLRIILFGLLGRKELARSYVEAFKVA